MTIKREDAKELLPIVKALAEGKMIQDSIDGSKWFDTDEINLEYEGKKIKHRIKPEPKYRPFKTQEECWNEMLKHQPFGWLKSKKTGSVGHVSTIYTKKDVGVSLIFATNEKRNFSPSDVIDDCVFIDGTPFGIKEE